MDGSWVPLMEYATRKGVSMSTLRRYIKADKIRYKLEHGKYLVWDDQPTVFLQETQKVPTFAASGLERQLQQAREEIVELKTLIAFYEEQLANQMHHGS